MRPEKQLALASFKPGDLDLILGAGGSRAILASTGVILAGHHAGISSWRTICGVSGGSVPAVMLAGGVEPTQIVRNVIEIDFLSQLTPLVSKPRIFWAFFVKECLWRKRRGRGVLGSENLGRYVEQHVPTWPKNFWTVAVAGKRSLLFTAEGVFEMLADGGLRQLSDKPAPVGLAIRATCAVPGIIDGVDYQGQLLLDGALSVGRCPTVLAKRYLNAQPGALVACDVGEEAVADNLFFRVMRRILCGKCCDPAPMIPTDTQGVVMVEPPPANIATLELKLSADQKWQVIMSGFTAAVDRLACAGLLAGDKLAAARSVVESYREIERTAKQPGELASRTQALMTAHNLY